MPLLQQIALRPGAYETAEGRQLRLTVADLARCRENTLTLLARGWRVPVFVGHAPSGSLEGGPRLAPPGDGARWIGRAQASTAVGRLVDVTVEPDGSLAHVLLIKRRFFAEVRRRKLRHTSPEIRPTFTTDAGEVHGPLIAHIALTNFPLCRGQTRLARVRRAPHSTNSDNPLTKGNEMPQEHEPYEANHELPEQPETDAATSAAAAVDDARPSASAVDRATLAERIRHSRKLPKGLRERLCQFVETIQLSGDASGEPVVPVAEAVAMIEAAVPEHLQLAADELDEPRHPRGEDFFRGHSTQMSDDEADRIAGEQLAASGFGPAA